jgi:pilus assembly protein Flp/PilA
MQIALAGLTLNLHPLAIWWRSPLWDRGMESDMKQSLVQFLVDQSGATAIEYGLIAAGIAVAIIAVVNALGTQFQSTFSTVSSQLSTAGK